MTSLGHNELNSGYPESLYIGLTDPKAEIAATLETPGTDDNVKSISWIKTSQFSQIFPRSSFYQTVSVMSQYITAMCKKYKFMVQS